MANASAASVYATLQQQGLSQGAALGIVGNLMAESSMNPRALGDGGTSHGIAQWHNERWTALVSWARSSGQDPYSLTAQTAYLIREAKSQGIWSKMQQVVDPFEAAKLWMVQFERPADQSDAAARRRLNLGQSALSGAAGTNAGLKLPGLDAAGSAIGDVLAPIKSIGTVFDHLMWWFNPTHIIRVAVGVSGVGFMLIGLVLLTREVRR